MAGETFDIIEFNNNTAPYMSDTNMNLMQTRIDNAIKTQKNRITDLKQMGYNGNVSTAGWYRVATIYGTANEGTLPGKGTIIDIVPGWNLEQPSSVMLSILTVFNKIKITQVNAIAVNNNFVPITKARALWDEANACFYIDAYYAYSTLNSIYVKNISLLDSDGNGSVEINTPVAETFSGTSLSEITINYNKIEPYYRYIDSYAINGWSANGQCLISVDECGVKHISATVRNGTSANMFQLPTELRPTNNAAIFPATNFTSAGYVALWAGGASAGIIEVSSNLFTSGSSDITFSGSYL